LSGLLLLALLRSESYHGQKFLSSFDTLWPLMKKNGNNSHAGGLLWLADMAWQIEPSGFFNKVSGHKTH
jgi:hypothetical protein